MRLRSSLSVLLLLFAAAGTAALPAHAATEAEQPSALDYSRVSLLSEHTALTPGGTHWLGIRIEHAPHWHTYWRNPGDSGLATRVSWRLPPGYAAGDIVWPAPRRLPYGELINFGYEGELLLPVPLQLPADARPGSTARIEATLSWLVCQDICIPGKQDLALELPVRAQPAGADPRWAALFAATRAALPVVRPDWQASVAEQGDAIEFRIAGAGTLDPANVELFPAVAQVTATVRGESRAGNGELVVRMPRSDYFRGLPQTVPLVLVQTVAGRRQAYAIEARAPAGAATTDPAPMEPLPAGVTALTAAPAPRAATPGLWLALLLAFGGGLLLNLMPCVFPVLSLKALQFARQGGGHTHRREGFYYLAGVLLSFAVLAAALIALRATGQALGWGFQLQQPLFVAVMAYFIFALGLSLSGVFVIAGGWTGIGQAQTRGGGARAAFMTGVLACVVASPCTAPLMGPALGYALTQPPAAALLIFLALGAGLAAPLFLLAQLPALGRWLPRPGPWLETFRQLMAFPLYLTAVWLLWVLGRQTGSDGLALALAGLVLLGFALWLWGRGHGRLMRAAALVCAAAALAPLLWLPAAPPATPVTATQPAAWQAYDAADLAALRAEGRPVFVNMTASWCITCLANERVALSSAEFAERLQRHGIAYLKGDWTDEDPAITEYLAGFGRSGVPLYVLYPRGGGEPRLLPQILTPALVLDALDRAAAPALAHSEP